MVRKDLTCEKCWLGPASATKRIVVLQDTKMKCRQLEAVVDVEWNNLHLESTNARKRQSRLAL